MADVGCQLTLFIMYSLLYVSCQGICISGIHCLHCATCRAYPGVTSTSNLECLGRSLSSNTPNRELEHHVIVDCFCWTQQSAFKPKWIIIIPVDILSTLIWDSILCAEFLHLLDCNVGLPVYTIWLEIHAIIICIFFSTFHWAFYLGENYQPRLNLYWLPGLNNFNVVFDS